MHVVLKIHCAKQVCRAHYILSIYGDIQATLCPDNKTCVTIKIEIIHPIFYTNGQSAQTRYSGSMKLHIKRRRLWPTLYYQCALPSNTLAKPNPDHVWLKNNFGDFENESRLFAIHCENSQSGMFLIMLEKDRVVSQI